MGIKPSSREFSVTSEEQLVEIKLERKVGRISLHLHPASTSAASGTISSGNGAELPLPTDVTLHLKHKRLDQTVMPAFPVGTNKAELYGENAHLHAPGHPLLTRGTRC